MATYQTHLGGKEIKTTYNAYLEVGRSGFVTGYTDADLFTPTYTTTLTEVQFYRVWTNRSSTLDGEIWTISTNLNFEIFIEDSNGDKHYILKISPEAGKYADNFETSTVANGSQSMITTYAQTQWENFFMKKFYIEPGGKIRCRVPGYNGINIYTSLLSVNLYAVEYVKSW